MMSPRSCPNVRRDHSPRERSLLGLYSNLDIGTRHEWKIFRMDENSIRIGSHMCRHGLVLGVNARISSYSLSQSHPSHTSDQQIRCFIDVKRVEGLAMAKPNLAMVVHLPSE